MGSMSSAATPQPVTTFVHALAIAIGAFLFFCIQPLVGKFLLPWFGGNSGIWTACMLFFQLILLIGYLYAHLLRTFLRSRQQVLTHGVLILLCLTQLPLVMEPNHSNVEPVVDILYLLTFSVGLPCALLAATAPLLQSWYSDITDQSPYPLYALSNAGSILALLSYPLLIEPWLPRQLQIDLWSWGLIAFLSSLLFCMVLRWQKAPLENPAPQTADKFNYLWILWPACAVALLLALTEHLTSNSLVVPFLWILPFGCYLITFIICFAKDEYGLNHIFRTALLILTPIWLWLYSIDAPNFATFLSINLAMLFVSCMVCHGELVKLKPEPRNLSVFYLSLAFGGALGGVSISVLAPIAYDLNVDLLIATLLLLCLCLVTLRQSRLYAGTSAVLIVMTLLVLQQEWRGTEEIVDRSRNFYGTLEVVRKMKDTENESLVLVNQGMRHGAQFQREHRKSDAIAHLTDETAAAIVLNETRGHKSRKIGLVGMGVGILLVYTDERDDVRLYELNPDVIRLAKTHFSFIEDTDAKVTILEGDARQLLTEESPQDFDLLILDAFTGDSIPLHLLTVEAFELYLSHLGPKGQILLLSDTRYMDFSHALQRIAQHLGLSIRGFWLDERDDEVWGAEWYLFARQHQDLTIKRGLDSDLNFLPDENYPLLTDEYTSLWHLIRWVAYEEEEEPTSD